MGVLSSWTSGKTPRSKEAHTASRFTTDYPKKVALGRAQLRGRNCPFWLPLLRQIRQFWIGRIWCFQRRKPQKKHIFGLLFQAFFLNNLFKIEEKTKVKTIHKLILICLSSRNLKCKATTSRPFLIKSTIQSRHFFRLVLRWGKAYRPRSLGWSNRQSPQNKFVLFDDFSVFLCAISTLLKVR